MLAGEYAVLRGGHALAVTVDYGMNISVKWEPLAASWTIHSNLWTSPKTVFDDHTPQSDILCRAVQFAAKKTGFHGGTVTVDSSLDIQHGLGSSSALRLGVCGAFFALQEHQKNQGALAIPREAINAAWQLQSESQGLASGYDIVTQYVGGLVEFSFEYLSNKWSPHWFKHHLGGLNKFVHVFVGGQGAPTTQTMHTTNAWLDSAGRLDKMMDVSESLVDAFSQALHYPSKKASIDLVYHCAASRSLFLGNPHFPVELSAKLGQLAGIDERWSWKTTGAGGEDAILLVGEPDLIAQAERCLNDSGWKRLKANFSESGAQVNAANDFARSEQEPTLKTRDDGDRLRKQKNDSSKREISDDSP